MTVKWDMQQKHGSPPRVMKKKKQLVWMKCNDPCAFYSPQHGGYKLFCACKAALPACSFKTNGCTAELDFRERNGLGLYCCLYCSTEWQVGTNMVEYLQNAETNQSFPHILCLGDKMTMCQAFTIVSGHAIETDSLLGAINVCFKSFFVFDINYTKQCLPTWEFLTIIIQKRQQKSQNSTQTANTEKPQLWIPPKRNNSRIKHHQNRSNRCVITTNFTATEIKRCK